MGAKGRTGGLAKIETLKMRPRKVEGMRKLRKIAAMGFWFLGYFSSYIEWSWDGYIAAFLFLNPFGFAFYNICTKLVLQESFDIPDVLFSTCHHYADHCDSSAIPPKALSKHEAFRFRHVHPSQLPRLILYRVFLSLLIFLPRTTLFFCSSSVHCLSLLQAQGAFVFNCTPCHPLISSFSTALTSLCCLMTDKPLNFELTISRAYILPQPPLTSWTCTISSQ